MGEPGEELMDVGEARAEVGAGVGSGARWVRVEDSTRWDAVGRGKRTRTKRGKRYRNTRNGLPLDTRLMNQNAHRGPINAVRARRGPMRVFSRKTQRRKIGLDRRVLSV